MTCLAYALEQEEIGVWGGTTAAERREERSAEWVPRDDRERADRIRRRILAGVPRTVVALEEAVSLRTLERWIAASGLTTQSLDSAA